MTAFPITWFEVYGKDRATLTKFYGDTFGWQARDIPEARYTEMTIGEIGMPGGGFTDGNPELSGFINYIRCPDIHEGVEKAVANGAEIVQPVTVYPGTVTFAILKDPLGNLFGLTDETVPAAD